MRKQYGRVNQFEENFEQSQNNIDEVYQQPRSANRVNGGQLKNSQYQNQQQAPIQLLKIKLTGEIQLNQQAINIINQYNKPIGFVCLAGKYRTGKSFLLNKILGLRGRGFKVDAATTACTQGIWMWSRPIYSSKEDCYLFFIDTEGSDSTNRDSDHDAKVFVLAILISSYFIYNSVGAIDQMSISQLNLVTTLSKRIAVSKQGNQDAFSYFMPKFLWLLRDFTLQMKDQRGKKLTPSEYLQNSLSQQNRQIRANQSIRNIRRALLQYFQDRDCLALVRPVNQESDLKNLNNIPDSRIRKQFIQGVNALKQKILANATAKTIKGQKLNSLMFTQLLYSFVQIINQHKIPNITSAWQEIRDRAGAEAFDAAKQQYRKLSSQNFSSDQPKGQQIHIILKQMRDKALQVYDQYLQVPDPVYRAKLMSVISQKQKAFLQVNNNINRQRNKQLIATFSKKITDNVRLGNYSTQNAKKLTQDYNQMITKYNDAAKGPTKCQVLTKFLQAFNPILINSFTIQTSKKVSQMGNSHSNNYQSNKQYEDIIKTQEQKIKSLQKQSEAKGNSKQVTKYTDHIKKLEVQNQKAKKQLQLLKNNKKTNCCQIF